MTEQQVRHVAGRARYRGAHHDLVRQTRGPLTYGGNVIATHATYDQTTDTTTVEFAHAVVGDPEPDPPLSLSMVKAAHDRVCADVYRRATRLEWWNVGDKV